MGVLSGLCCSDFLPLPLGMSLAPPLYPGGVLEPVGNAFALDFVGNPEQPQEQEEGHHGGHEVGIGHLPGAAVVAPAALDHLLDDNGLFLVVCHGFVSVPVRSPLLLLVLDVFFELGEARPQMAVQRLAPELHGDLRG